MNAALTKAQLTGPGRLRTVGPCFGVIRDPARHITELEKSRPMKGCAGAAPAPKSPDEFWSRNQTATRICRAPDIPISGNWHDRSRDGAGAPDATGHQFARRSSRSAANVTGPGVRARFSGRPCGWLTGQPGKSPVGRFHLDLRKTARIG